VFSCRETRVKISKMKSIRQPHVRRRRRKEEK
jgi:hypothetical protein